MLFGGEKKRCYSNFEILLEILLEIDLEVDLEIDLEIDFVFSGEPLISHIQPGIVLVVFFLSSNGHLFELQPTDFQKQIWKITSELRYILSNHQNAIPGTFPQPRWEPRTEPMRELMA